MLEKECVSDRMCKWHSVCGRMCEWQSAWVAECVSDRVWEWQNLWVAEFVSGRICEWQSVWVTECACAHARECISVSVCAREETPTFAFLLPHFLVSAAPFWRQRREATGKGDKTVALPSLPLLRRSRQRRRKPPAPPRGGRNLVCLDTMPSC